MARIFATLDRNACGPSMVLEQSDLVVTTKDGSLTMNRMARGNTAAIEGRLYFEVAFYGEGALPDQAAVGIVLGTHSLQKYVGEDSGPDGVRGYGYLVGNGSVYAGDQKVANVPATNKKTYIGILVDMVGKTCSWYVSGSLVATVAIGDKPWYPAVTVSATKSYDLRCYANFGQYAFAHVVDGIERMPGWYTDTAGPSTRYFRPRNSSSFMVDAAGSSRRVFEPRIINADSASVTTRGSVWWWGAGSNGSSYGELEIDNADGSLDVDAGTDRRDQIARIAVAQASDTYGQAITAFTAVIDDVTCIGESRLRYKFRDVLTTLDRPLQRRIFPPWADPGVAFKPVPMTFGACRNVAPILEDQVTHTYRLHDAPVTNISAVRDMGALLDPHALPVQYERTPDMQGIKLHAQPAGLLAADISSEGEQVDIPGVPDILGGKGVFNDWTPVSPVAPPAGWSRGGVGNLSALKVVVPNQTPQWAVQLSTNQVYDAHQSQHGNWLRYDGTAAVIKPGKRYRLYFHLASVTNTYFTTGGRAGGLLVRMDEGEILAGAITPLSPISSPGFYTFEFGTPPGQADKKLYFIAAAPPTNDSGASNGTVVVQFRGVVLEELGEVTQSLPLEGITLEKYWAEVFRRAGVADSAWNRNDCRAIDAATGYRFGVHIPDAISVVQALKLPLDTFGAAMFTDAQGVIRVRRLVDPSDVPDNKLKARFTESDIVHGVTPRNDLAPGLTTAIGARRNWHVYGDSDFVTDERMMPPALRTQFKSTHQLQRNATSSLSPSYAFALNAPPLESVLETPPFAATDPQSITPDSAQREISRVVAPYAATSSPNAKLPTLPRFIEFTVNYDGAAPPALMFGDVIKVTYPRHRLANGQKFAVVGTTINPYAKTMQIVAWGTQ